MTSGFISAPFEATLGVLLRHRERPDQYISGFETLRTRSTKTAVSKLVLVTFPELNQAFDVGERLTLPLPVSFDPVKGVDLILQLPWRKLSRGCIFDKNAHTTQCFEKIWLLTYSRHQIAVN